MPNVHPGALENQLLLARIMCGVVEVASRQQAGDDALLRFGLYGFGRSDHDGLLAKNTGSDEHVKSPLPTQRHLATSKSFLEVVDGFNDYCSH